MKYGNGPVPDDVFSFRYDLGEDTLQISAWKGSGVVAQGVILEGKYVTEGGPKPRSRFTRDVTPALFSPSRLVDKIRTTAPATRRRRRLSC